MCRITQQALYSPPRGAEGLKFEFNLDVIWLSCGFQPSLSLCCCSAADQIPATHFQAWMWLFKAFHGPNLQPRLRFSVCPEVSLLCCRSAGLCNLQPESIALREFKVSDYMASALGRLERYRGNATLHGFFYTVLISATRASELILTGANICFPDARSFSVRRKEVLIMRTECADGPKTLVSCKD